MTMALAALVFYTFRRVLLPFFRKIRVPIKIRSAPPPKPKPKILPPP